MKTSTKTLLVSVLAIACAGGAYAQGAGGGAGGSAGAGGSTGTGSAGGSAGTGGGMGGGAAPSGNTLQRPTTQPGMNGVHNGSGYGSPGSTGTSSGRSTLSPRTHRHERSGMTGGSTSTQGGQPDEGHGGK